VGNDRSKVFGSEPEILCGEDKQNGPYIEIDFTDNRLTEFRDWLRGESLRLATEQKLPEQV
jgi:hypothetical protein